MATGTGDRDPEIDLAQKGLLVIAGPPPYEERPTAPSEKGHTKPEASFAPTASNVRKTANNATAMARASATVLRSARARCKIAG